MAHSQAGDSPANFSAFPSRNFSPHPRQVASKRHFAWRSPRKTGTEDISNDKRTCLCDTHIYPTPSLTDRNVWGEMSPLLFLLVYTGYSPTSACDVTNSISRTPGKWLPLSRSHLFERLEGFQNSAFTRIPEGLW